MDPILSPDYYGRDSADTPYDRNLEFHELFRTFRAYIARIRSTLTAEVQRVHLNALDEMLQWVSVGFSPDLETSHTCTLLFLAILLKIYELLRQCVEREQLGVEAKIGDIIPHGQVHVSLEKKAAQLKLKSGEVEAVEDLLHEIQRDINQAIEGTTEPDEMLIGSEIWSKYLAAVVFILSPRSIDDLNESVQMAMERIKTSLARPPRNGYSSFV